MTHLAGFVLEVMALPTSVMSHKRIVGIFRSRQAALDCIIASDPQRFLDQWTVGNDKETVLWGYKGAYEWYIHLVMADPQVIDIEVTESR